MTVIWLRLQMNSQCSLKDLKWSKLSIPWFLKNFYTVKLLLAKAANIVTAIYVLFLGNLKWLKFSQGLVYVKQYLTGIDGNILQSARKQLPSGVCSILICLTDPCPVPNLHKTNSNYKKRNHNRKTRWRFFPWI